MADTLPPLLKPCDKCDGRPFNPFQAPAPPPSPGVFGMGPMVTTPVPCERCGGSGKVPTDAGKQILELMLVAKPWKS